MMHLDASGIVLKCMARFLYVLLNLPKLCCVFERLVRCASGVYNVVFTQV